MHSLPILLIALGLIVLGIVGLRLHPFLVLVATALAVVALAPVPVGTGDARTAGGAVAEGFGRAALDVGIPVAMATILGHCLSASRAAERIVVALGRALGPQRTPLAFTAAGLVLGITMLPQAVLSLLLPLARTAAQVRRRHSLLLLLSIVAGATMTPALVPPAPGPLYVADRLGVDLLLAIRLGLFVGGVSALVGLAFARRADRSGIVALGAPQDAHAGADEPPPAMPRLPAALLPILLPVTLIALGTGAAAFPIPVAAILRTLGDKHVALSLGAVAAVLLTRAAPGGTTRAPRAVREGVVEAGEVVLVIAAGGALGKAFEQAGIPGLASTVLPADPTMLLPAAFAITALLRTALGSATVAMITAAGIVAPLAASNAIPLNPVYLLLAIGCGSKPGMWMNDSGFWTISRLGGLPAGTTLRTASVMITLEGIVGLAVTLLLARIWPLV